MEAHPLEEEVYLPSRGIPYGDVLPEGKVCIRPMTLREEKLLLSMRKDKLSILDEILENCLLTKTMPLRDYLIGDKAYLMLILRVISYGKDYKFKFTCPSPDCMKKFDHEITLPDSLRIISLDEGDTEPYDITLPKSKSVVSLRYLRGSDELELEKIGLKAKKQDEDILGDMLVLSMVRSIVAVDGKTMTVPELHEFCENLVVADAGAIREAINKRQCGPMFDITVECPECQFELEANVSLTTDFFRPRGGPDKGGFSAII